MKDNNAHYKRIRKQFNTQNTNNDYWLYNNKDNNVINKNPSNKNLNINKKTISKKI